MFTVYRITCSSNKKQYVGWTSLSIESRWKKHINGKRLCYIKLCINKYGKDNFCIEELHKFDTSAEAIAKEIELIKLWQLNISRFPDGGGMNMTDGGEGTIGYKATDLHRHNLSKSMSGKQKSPEHAERIREAKRGCKNPMFDRVSTDKQKQSSRDRFLANNPNKKGCESHMFGKPGYWKGKTKSPEILQKMSDSMKGKNTGPRSQEIKDKLRQKTLEYLAINGHPGLGRKHTPESREKMSLSRLAYLEKQKYQKYQNFD